MQHRHVLLLVCLLLIVSCTEQQNVRVPSHQPVPAATRNVGSNGLDGDEEQAILSYHNQVRASVGVPPLVWSKEVAQHATDWSARLATQGCTIQHSQDNGYGENIFMGTANQGHDAVIEAAKTWESEKVNFSGEALNKSVWSQAGHYTQMVWRDTSDLGCAKASCGDNLIVVCNYKPAGNILGEKPY
jgi:pathogenesis-related protein 1